MPSVDVDHFERQADCTYRGERYSVRDNGAVFRHPNGKRRRANDSQWTFHQARVLPNALDAAKAQC